MTLSLIERFCLRRLLKLTNKAIARLDKHALSAKSVDERSMIETWLDELRGLLRAALNDSRWRDGR